MRTLLWLEHALLETRISLATLKRVLFGKPTEKTPRKPPAEPPADAASDSGAEPANDTQEKTEASVETPSETPAPSPPGAARDTPCIGPWSPRRRRLSWRRGPAL
ncbi:MAG: hypothetical protein VBE63_28730 [Lamprobacter sp.]|uniref:hypothetical protein n=1 Tax=Lamprobacter sp. TaxID=3100796 RepID=UPI002B25AF8B|nr:hypothetical protein [Lamprobacter sp.]MEA3643882.1 hypothetical protein [Lamprobacter sp.]